MATIVEDVEQEGLGTEFKKAQTFKSPKYDVTTPAEENLESNLASAILFDYGPLTSLRESYSRALNLQPAQLF